MARGNKQSKDDFNNMFTPVFQLDSLQILIALTARYRLLAHLLDTSTFAGSDLDKLNYIEILKRLQDFDPKANIKEGMVLELRKSLYRLYQSVNL